MDVPSANKNSKQLKVKRKLNPQKLHKIVKIQFFPQESEVLIHSVLGYK